MEDLLDRLASVLGLSELARIIWVGLVVGFGAHLSGWGRASGVCWSISFVATLVGFSFDYYMKHPSRKRAFREMLKSYIEFGEVLHKLYQGRIALVDWPEFWDWKNKLLTSFTNIADSNGPPEIFSQSQPAGALKELEEDLEYLKKLLVSDKPLNHIKPEISGGDILRWNFPGLGNSFYQKKL